MSGLRLAHSARDASLSLLRFCTNWFTLDERRTDPLGWTFNLAIFRIVFLAYVVLPAARHVLHWTSHVMPGLPHWIWAPISFYRYIPPAVLTDAGFARWLAGANIILIILALAGACTRYTLGLATVLSIYLFGLTQNLGKVDHGHHVVWIMALLAAGPSGYLLSIDAIVRAVRRAGRGLVEPEVPGFSALWTLRYTWALIGLVYLGPGLAKLQAALMANWADAENLRRVMWAKWFELWLYHPHYAAPPRADQLPSWILEAFGRGAILFEVGFIVLVLFRPTRWLAALGGILFHELNRWILWISFTSLEVAYVGLFDWSALARSFAALRGRRPLVALYDGGCTLCRRTMAILRTIDVSSALEPVAGLSDDPRRRRYPDVSDGMLVRDMYVIREGNPLRGYDAYVAIAARMPVLWPISLIMRLPPIPTVGRAVYRRVADARRCPAAPLPSPAAPPVRTESRWVHRVGASLVIAQAAVSLTAYSAGMRLSFLPKPVKAPVRAVLGRYTSLQLKWPFDLYPTFSDTQSDHSVIWEARVIYAGGRERRVAAEPYAKLCRPARCLKITGAVLEEQDPARQRKRSLAIVRHLWRHLGAGMETGAVGMRIYRARYSTEPGATQPLAEELMHEFSIDAISLTPTQKGGEK